MLKITEKDIKVRGNQFASGDLFTDNAGEFYILAEIYIGPEFNDMQFVAVNIATGGYWAPLDPDSKSATGDLLLVRSGSKIELEVY